MENLRAKFLLERLQREYPSESEDRLLRAIRVINSTAKGDENWDEYVKLIQDYLQANPQPL